MDAKTEYFEQTKALKDTDLMPVRGVDGVGLAVRVLKRLISFAFPILTVS